MEKQRLYRSICLLLVTGVFPGCSLGGLVGASAADYEAAGNAYSNQMLLKNILRARDGIPVSFTELSTITGTLSLSTGVSVTAPFGDLHGSSTRSGVTPTATITSSPNFSMASLDTESFTLRMMQPVSPSLVMAFQQFYDKRLLFNLFVKSVRIGDVDFDDGTFVKGLTAISIDQPKTELKAFTVLDPIGPRFALNPSKSPDAGLANLSSLAGTLSSLAPGQIYAGNAGVLRPDSATGQSNYSSIQLYRVYPLQVELCAAAGGTGVSIRPVENATTSSVAQPFDGQQLLSAHVGGGSPGPTPTPTATPSTGAQSSGRAGSPSSTASTASTQTAVAAALQANRVSAIIDANQCNTNQFVLQASSEEKFASASSSFNHIKWRSPLEVIQHLGILTRSKAADPLFSVTPGSGPVTVSYNGQEWTVPPVAAGPSSTQVLQILSVVVNLQKLSSDIPITQQLLVVP